MKYDETIIEIEEKVLSVQYEKTNIKGKDPFEYSDNLNLFKQRFICPRLNNSVINGFTAFTYQWDRLPSHKGIWFP